MLNTNIIPTFYFVYVCTIIVSWLREEAENKLKAQSNQGPHLSNVSEILNTGLKTPILTFTKRRMTPRRDFDVAVFVEKFQWKNKCQPHGRVRGKVRRSPKSFGFILWEPWMSLQNCVPIHQVDVEVFHWICDRFSLLVALKWKVRG